MSLGGWPTSQGLKQTWELFRTWSWNVAMVRRERIHSWLHSLFSDCHFALSQLRKSPGFTTVAVLTLVLGIGATAAIFTLIQQAMLRSLAVAKPEQLWRIGDAVTCCYSTGYTQSNHTAENDWTLFSWEAYQRFRGDTAAFEQLAAFQVGTGNGYVAVRRAGSREAVQSRLGEFVSGNSSKRSGSPRGAGVCSSMPTMCRLPCRSR